MPHSLVSRPGGSAAATRPILPRDFQSGGGVCGARVLVAVAVLSAVLLTAPAARAQVRGGLGVGVSAYTLTGNARADFSPRSALAARLWVEREVRPGVAVGTGAAYLPKGARGTARVGDIFPVEGGPDRILRLRLDYPYIEIPLTVALDGPALGRWRTQVYAGPFVGLRQSAAIEYGLDGGPLEGREVDRSVRPRDIGAAGGIVARIDAGTFGDLAAGLHVSGGLTNVRQTDPPLRTLGALVYVGVGF